MSAAKNVAVLATDSSVPVQDFASRLREEMIPLNQRISYFFVGATPTSEDMREFLEEPVAALPPVIAQLIQRADLLFVPFLEQISARKNATHLVSLVRPAKPVTHSRTSFPDRETFVAAFHDRDIGEYHYRFFQFIATLTADQKIELVEKDYTELVRQELKNKVHGEVDDLSWEKKIALLERQSTFQGTNKQFRDYVRQSFIDTLTLYLHGICCDLDVEPGPRQMASRHLRKRLEFLKEKFPPPAGHAVFPEDKTDE